MQSREWAGWPAGGVAGPAGQGVEDVGWSFAERAVGGDVGLAAYSADIDGGVRRAAMTGGPWPLRTLEWSSTFVTTRAQCRQFSIVQCDRIDAAKSRGPAPRWPGDR